MKKSRVFLSALTALPLVFSFASCAAVENKADGLNIVATNFTYFDMVRQISAGECLPELLISGGQDSHSYEPTVGEMIRISEADILICTGGESDSWVDEMLSGIESDVVVLKMMDYVEPLCAEEHEDEEEHHEHAHSHEEYDEHIWTSPKNAVIIAEEIAKAMYIADPDNADSYKNGMADFRSELEKLDSELAEAAANLTKPLIFGDRFPFLYMAHDYGIAYKAAFSGCSSETEPSAARMTELITAAEEYDVSVIFHIEFSTEKVANTIAEATGGKTDIFYSCHSVYDEDMENGETYVSLMRKNIAAMKELSDNQ